MAPSRRDDGVGWIIQLIVSIGALLLATFGRGLLTSQSAITVPVLVVAGVAGVVSVLYSRLRPRPKPKPSPRRDD